MTRRRTGPGRITPKGTRPEDRKGGGDVPADDDGTPIGRVDPAVRPAKGPSPMWVPILMLTLLAIGGLLIVFNYVGWVPGGTDNIWLGVGLVFIFGGTVTATQWR